MCSFIYSRWSSSKLWLCTCSSVLVACWSTVCPRVVGGTVVVHISLFQRVPRAHSSLLLADGALECCPRQCRFIVVDIASLSRSPLDNVTRWEFTSSTAVLGLSGVAGLDRFGNVGHCCEVFVCCRVDGATEVFVLVLCSGLFVVCCLWHPATPKPFYARSRKQIFTGNDGCQ